MRRFFFFCFFVSLAFSWETLRDNRERAWSQATYRIALQALGISRSELTLLQIVPTNVLIFFSLGVQCWVLARRFFRAVGSRKLTTFLWIIGSRAFPFIVGILFSGFIYPAYDKQDKTVKIYIAVFTPLITVLLKGSSRLFLQRLWKISHPGKTFVFLAPLRLLQVDLNSLKAVALIGVIHAVAEVIERMQIISGTEYRR